MQVLHFVMCAQKTPKKLGNDEKSAISKSFGVRPALPSELYA